MGIDCREYNHGFVVTRNGIVIIGYIGVTFRGTELAKGNHKKCEQVQLHPVEPKIVNNGLIYDEVRVGHAELER